MYFVRITLTALLVLLITGCGGGGGGNSPADVNGNPVVQALDSGYTAMEDQTFSIFVQASDPEGDTLTFDLNNAPDWLRINRTTGEISGIPTRDNVGVFDDITVSVSDRIETTVSSSFSVEVLQVDYLQLIGEVQGFDLTGAEMKAEFDGNTVTAEVADNQLYNIQLPLILDQYDPSALVTLSVTKEINGRPLAMVSVAGSIESLLAKADDTLKIGAQQYLRIDITPLSTLRDLYVTDLLQGTPAGDWATIQAVESKIPLAEFMEMVGFFVIATNTNLISIPADTSVLDFLNTRSGTTYDFVLATLQADGLADTAENYSETYQEELDTAMDVAIDWTTPDGFGLNQATVLGTSYWSAPDNYLGGKNLGDIVEFTGAPGTNTAEGIYYFRSEFNGTRVYDINEVPFVWSVRDTYLQLRFTDSNPRYSQLTSLNYTYYNFNSEISAFLESLGDFTADEALGTTEDLIEAYVLNETDQYWQVRVDRRQRHVIGGFLQDNGYTGTVEPGQSTINYYRVVRKPGVAVPSLTAADFANRTWALPVAKGYFDDRVPNINANYHFLELLRLNEDGSTGGPTAEGNEYSWNFDNNSLVLVDGADRVQITPIAESGYAYLVSVSYFLSNELQYKHTEYIAPQTSSAANLANDFVLPAADSSSTPVWLYGNNFLSFGSFDIDGNLKSYDVSGYIFNASGQLIRVHHQSPGSGVCDDDTQNCFYVEPILYEVIANGAQITRISQNSLTYREREWNVLDYQAEEGAWLLEMEYLHSETGGVIENPEYFIPPRLNYIELSNLNEWPELSNSASQF